MAIIYRGLVVILIGLISISGIAAETPCDLLLSNILPKVIEEKKIVDLWEQLKVTKTGDEVDLTKIDSARDAFRQELLTNGKIEKAPVEFYEKLAAIEALAETIPPTLADKKTIQRLYTLVDRFDFGEPLAPNDLRQFSISFYQLVYKTPYNFLSLFKKGVQRQVEEVMIRRIQERVLSDRIAKAFGHLGYLEKNNPASLMKSILSYQVRFYDIDAKDLQLIYEKGFDDAFAIIRNQKRLVSHVELYYAYLKKSLAVPVIAGLAYMVLTFSDPEISQPTDSTAKPRALPKEKEKKSVDSSAVELPVTEQELQDKIEMLQVMFKYRKDLHQELSRTFIEESFLELDISLGDVLAVNPDLYHEIVRVLGTKT